MMTNRLKRLAAAFTVNGWIYKQIPEEKGGFLAVFFLCFCYQSVIVLFPKCNIDKIRLDKVREDKYIYIVGQIPRRRTRIYKKRLELDK